MFFTNLLIGSEGSIGADDRETLNGGKQRTVLRITVKQKVCGGVEVGNDVATRAVEQSEPPISVTQQVCDALATKAWDTVSKVSKNDSLPPVVLQVVPDGYYYAQVLKGAKDAGMVKSVIPISAEFFDPENAMELYHQRKREICQDEPGNIIVCDAVFDTGMTIAKILLVLKKQKLDRKYHLAFLYLKSSLCDEEDIYADARTRLAEAMASAQTCKRPFNTQVEQHLSWIKDHILSFYAASCLSSGDMPGRLVLPAEDGNPIDSSCLTDFVRSITSSGAGMSKYSVLICFSSEMNDYKENQELSNLLNYMSEHPLLKGRVSYGIGYPSSKQGEKVKEVFFAQDTRPKNRGRVLGIVAQKVFGDYTDFTKYIIRSEGLKDLCYPNPIPLLYGQCDC
ncbi:MAG: hypothetical protein OXC30_03670 [Alphaproteobacteria bacterium]|nr:hypothetical protein [Alphaproteobacteria bacterium]